MMTAAFVLVLAILVLVNVWVHLGLRQAHLVTGPLAALVLLLVARAAGLSWAELGLARDDLLPGLLYGAAAAGAIAVVYAVGGARPGHPAGLPRHPLPGADAGRRADEPGGDPAGTVVFEEVAFRSVLWGMLEHERGAGGRDGRVLGAVRSVARAAGAGRGAHQHGDPGQRPSGPSPGAADRARDGGVHGRRGARLRRAAAAQRQPHRPARPALGDQRLRRRGRRAGLGGQPAGVRAGWLRRG